VLLLLVRVGAAGAGFLLAIGSKGAGNGQFQHPCGGVTFDADGNLVMSDDENHRVQVCRYSDVMRSMGISGAGNGPGRSINLGALCSMPMGISMRPTTAMQC
jgi:hypothetical protein